MEGSAPHTSAGHGQTHTRLGVSPCCPPPRPGWPGQLQVCPQSPIPKISAHPCGDLPALELLLPLGTPELQGLQLWSPSRAGSPFPLSLCILFSSSPSDPTDSPCSPSLAPEGTPSISKFKEQPLCPLPFSSERPRGTAQGNLLVADVPRDSG